MTEHPQSAALPPPVYRLGDFVLDIARGELLHAGQRTGLSLRSQRLLHALMERAGDVVTNEELLASIDDAGKARINAIQKCITELRATLGDSRTEPRYIETVMKRGYRLLVRPEILEPEAGKGGPDGMREALSAATPAGTAQWTAGAPSTPPVWLVGAACAAVICLASVAFWLVHAGAATSSVRTPLVASEDAGGVNQGAQSLTSVGLATIRCEPANASTQRLCSRLGDLVRSGLERLDDVRVVPAPEVPGQGRGASDPPAYVLDLSLEQSSDRLVMMAALHESASHSRVYVYERDISLAMAEQDLPRHAATVLSALEVHLNPEWRADMQSAGTRNVEAYRAWASGYYMLFPIGLQRLAAASSHARRAIELDPGFIAAYTSLQQALTIEGRIQTDEAQRRRLSTVARDMSDELGRVDPTSSELIALRALRLRLGGATPRRLEEDARRSIELSRGAACECFLDYADLLIGARLYAEAEDLLQARGARNFTLAWQYRRRELIALLRDGPDVALRRRGTLGGFRNNVVLLSLVLPLLQTIGDTRTADTYQSLLEEHDRGGYWATFGRLQRAHVLARHGAGTPTASTRMQTSTDALVRGVLHFMDGDVPTGVKAWRQLDSRMLQHLAWYLPIHELSFPPHVLRSPEYQAVLEALGIGASWTRYIRARAAEIAQARGVSR